MPVNNFLPFATAVGANVESQSAYASDPLVPVGNQSGTTALSALNNKVLRQSSVISSQFAQYMSEQLGQDVLDNGDTAAIKTQIAALLQSWQGPIDGTLAVTAGTLGVKTAGLTHIQLSNSAGITRNQLNLPNLVLTGNSAAFNTQSATPVAITGLSASITTIGGGPVQITLIPQLYSIFFATFGQIGVNIASYSGGGGVPANATAYFVLLRGGVPLISTGVNAGLPGTMALGSGAGVTHSVPAGSINFTDYQTQGIPGTYTYTMTAQVVVPSGMTASAFCSYCGFILKEL